MLKKDLTPFKEYIIQRLNKGISNGKKLFSEIQDEGFDGSYRLKDRIGEPTEKLYEAI